MSHSSIYFLTIFLFSVINVSKSTVIKKERVSKDLSIIGGYNASITDHPYQASLSYRSEGEEHFVCGGSIISKHYILTADHCSYELEEPSGIIARVGSASRKNGTVIPIAQIIFHPDRRLDLDLDVLLLKTAKPITFNDVIRPVKLPVENMPLEDNSTVVVSGWGLTKEDDKLWPIQLLAVKMPVVNFYTCWTIFGDSLTRNMWCAGYLQSGGKGPCNGDSGGPAVQNGVLFGVVSWSRGCAEKGYPTVFADVAAPAIRDFIRNHTML